MDSRTRRSLADAAKYLPGGTYATASRTERSQPEYLVSHGEGAYLYYTDGTRLLDVTLGHGSLLLGHSHLTVVEAVKAQAELGNNFTQVTQPAIELARMIVEAVPCGEKVRLVNSGTEAVLVALRLVRAFTGREKVLKFEGAYHGFADGLMFNTNYGDPNRWLEPPQAYPDTPGIPAVERGLVLTAPYNDLERTREIVRDSHGEMAAIFVEPVMRGLASRPGFLEGVREIALEYGIPLVFDEVITGFRLALGGAQTYYGVTPDLAVFGKGLGSGYPIGAITGGEEIMAPLDPASPDGERIFSLGSFHGNAVCAAAAVATLMELQKPGVYEHLESYGNRLRDGLSDLFARYDLPAQMTGAGSVVEWFFTSEPVSDYRSTLGTGLKVKKQLGATMRNHGLFGGGGRFSSSTRHGDTELELTMNAMEAGLREILNKLPPRQE